MKPIVKWAGGKTQLLPLIKERLPVNFGKHEYQTYYYEPFLGGGAVLLGLKPTMKRYSAAVNDINPELINMYCQVRDNVEALIEMLANLDSNHENSVDPKQFYYGIRNVYNEQLGTNTIMQAARFIYLNKHCFNGLYRVNSKGEFNVPFNGKMSGKSFDPDHLREVSKSIQDVTFNCNDFEQAVGTAGFNDFVFFDSPYVPITTTSFIDYTKEGFSYEDHVRLAKVFKELTMKGCYCMLTNHDTPLIRELYKDYRIEVVDVHRSINRNGNDRKGTEVIITNYNPTGDIFVPTVKAPLTDEFIDNLFIDNLQQKLYGSVGIPTELFTNK